MSISQNTALFSILGTTYGDNGQSAFALPDLRGSVAVDAGQGPGLSDWVLGQVDGTETNTLTINEMAAHTHTFTVEEAPSTPEPGTLSLLGLAVVPLLCRRGKARG